MQKYFKLDWTTEGKKNIFIEGFDMSEKVQKEGNAGVSLSNEPSPDATLKNKKGIKADVLVGGSTFPVVSESFKNLLTAFVDDTSFLEFIPINFENLNSADKIPAYYLLNILENIPAFDWDNSTYKRYPKDVFPDHQHLVRKIEKLVINHKPIGDRNIFRIVEKSVPVYIRQFLNHKVLMSFIMQKKRSRTL